jgi:hypothetical protein
MRISEALAEEKTLTIPFGESVLTIQYRPPSWTIEEVDGMQNDEGTKKTERLVEMIQRVIVGWDLTDDSGELVDCTEPAAIRKIPITILNKITKAIREDNGPGEA